jgi:AAA domain, putative AbiEii toxin, Type IV TA system
LDQTGQIQSQSSLYNYSNKYNNVKSEMASSFIKELLAEKASIKSAEGQLSITDTLIELFEKFFPDKKFDGPKATTEGSIDFPVKTLSGTTHDLDELSSGEKEILYGYLRIRSSAPKDSIILLDEPELHLNPRLIRGLPEFYKKHLGEALQNQLWLVTHSDALIREAVGRPGFNVFHMTPCGTDGSETSQLKPLTVTGDLDLVLADLIGDLAAYRPGGKGLIFEGGGNSDFDRTFALALFAEELNGINLISGSNKTRVKALHEILDKAYKAGDQPIKFFAVVDRDSDVGEEKNVAVSRFTWDVYHIENYLLEVDVIVTVMNQLNIGATTDATAVHKGLKEAAEQVLPNFLAHRMRSFANKSLLDCIDFGFDPKATDVGDQLSNSIVRTGDRIKSAIENELSLSKITEVLEAENVELLGAFSDGSWIKTLPGRDILRKFVENQKITIGYEYFRNLILGQMRDKGIKPLGMKAVFEKIRAG